MPINSPINSPAGNPTWIESKPVKIVLAVTGLAMATAIVPQQSRTATYVATGIIGGAVGFLLLNSIFNFDYNYSNNDKYAELKGKLEGALVGASIAMGVTALRDSKTSNRQKLIISAGIGSLLGYISTDAEFFGSHPYSANAIGAISGAVVGGGLYLAINKIKVIK